MRGLRYLSVCSGIEAATVAWHPLGWEAAAFSEIEAFPRAVLAHHYPDTPVHGDFTTIGADEYGPIDLLVGGTPCQSFSIAGLRGGLADDRGNLALEYLRLADRKRPRWLVWENVPGVLSSSGGRDFGSILGGMAELGYGFAYRILDAQFFGVAQRRRRVFVVGYLGDWRRAAAVLFERHSLSGYPAPRREARQVAPTIPSRSSAGGGLGTDFDCDGGLIALTGNDGMDEMIVGHVAPTLTSNGDAHSGFRDDKGFVPVHSVTQDSTPVLGDDISPALKVGTGFDMGQPPAVAFAVRGRDGGAQAEAMGEQTGALRASQGGSSNPFVGTASAVRRLTPRECERLQGFPDDYSLVPYRGKPAADGPRYKALGNSMAVPVMAWIGERIDAVESLASHDRAAA